MDTFQQHKRWQESVKTLVSVVVCMLCCVLSESASSLLGLLNPVLLSTNLDWSGKHCIRCFKNSRSCWRKILKMRLAKWSWIWKLHWWSSTQHCWDKVCFVTVQACVFPFLITVIKSFLSHMAHGMALISVSLALSYAAAYTARFMWIWGPVWCASYSSAFTVTHCAYPRLSSAEWLVTYWNRLCTCRMNTYFSTNQA